MLICLSKLTVFIFTHFCPHLAASILASFIGRSVSLAANCPMITLLQLHISYDENVVIEGQRFPSTNND